MNVKEILDFFIRLTADLDQRNTRFSINLLPNGKRKLKIHYHNDNFTL